MPREIGPREKALREQREARFAERNRPSPDQLRDKVAKIPPTTGKRKAKKKAKR